MSTGMDAAVNDAISTLGTALERTLPAGVVRGIVKVANADHQYEINYQRIQNQNTGLTEYEARVVAGLGAGATVFAGQTLDLALKGATVAALVAAPEFAPATVLFYANGIFLNAKIAESAGFGTADMATMVFQSSAWADIKAYLRGSDSNSPRTLSATNIWGNDTAVQGTSHFKGYLNLDGAQLLSDYGASYNSSDVAIQDGVTFAKSDAQANIQGEPYLITQIFDSIETAAASAAKFISDQAGINTEWFTNVSSQQVVTNWLAANIGNLLNGTMSADQALISLAIKYGETYISGFVQASIGDVAGAKDVLSGVFENHFDLDKTLAVKYADSFHGALGQMAITFATGGFNQQQAVNAGVSYLTSQVTATYLSHSFGSVTAAGGSAAAATAVIALVSGNFSGNWAQLGLQVGLAAVYASAGEALALALEFAPLGPQAAIAAAVIAFIGSKILGGLFGSGKHFYTGEFPSVAALYGSIYQVQTITVNGQEVPALVAVNASGSTIIASGTGIGYVSGNTGADVLVADDNVQTIAGNGSADYLEANGGNDNLLGGDGSDHLNGGAGNDVLQGDAGDDIILAEAGNDTVVGGAGNDFVHLGTGDDIAAAGDGSDYVVAGGGNDAISGGTGDDSLDGGYGDDSIQGDEGSDLILANLGNDYAEGGDGSDAIFGDAGNDQIHGGNDKDFIDGGAGIDLLYGDAGRDIIAGGDEDDFADGGIGADDILGGNGNDVLLGGMDDDYVSGDAGDDSIDGGFGNDILIGGAGVNTLAGGDGSDIYVIGADAAEHHAVILDENSTTNVDTILLSWMTDASSSLTLLKNGDDLILSSGTRTLATVSGQFLEGNSIERIELAGGGHINLAAVNYDATSHLGAFTVELASGGGVLPAVTARAKEVQDNLLSKEIYWNNTFLNKLSQLAYDEQLSEQTVYTYHDGTEFQHYQRSQGKFGGKYSIYKLAQPGSIDGTEFVSLDYVVQDDEDQTSAAAFGNDKTTLAGPYESLINNASIVYSTFGGKSIQDIVINGTVVSTKVAGEATHYAAGSSVYGSTYAQRSSAGTTAVADVAVKKLGGDLLVGAYWDETIDGKSGDDILAGNDGNDAIIGSDGNDWGFGGAGDDALSGGNGDDVLFGGDGNDSISGGANDDAILGAAGNDVITGDTGHDWIDAGAGNDSVDTGDGNDIIVGGDGDDTLIGGTGNDVIHGNHGNDALHGGDGHDTLIGGFGNDSLYGGTGNDVLNGDGGAILLDGGDGQDTIVFEASPAGIVINLQSGSYTGPGAVGLTVSNFENVTGTIYDDVIYSGSAANTIDGGDGVDAVMYTESNAAVTINLATGAASGGYATGDLLLNVEVIVGSSHSDMIEGSAAANSIDGGAGNDTVSYAGSAAAVSVNLATNANTGGNAQGDTLTSIENIIGSAHDDAITANAVNNLITLGAGNDSVIGGLGADTIDGGAGLDTASYASSSAAVTVNLVNNTNTGGDAQGDLLAGIENVHGSLYSDLLTGDAGGNVLHDGGAGDDTLIGGSGNDTYVINTTSVVLTENVGEGTDSIQSHVSHTLGANVENLTLMGSASISATGNSLNNVLIGNSGDNTLIGGAGGDTLDGGAGIDTLSYAAAPASIYLDLALTTPQPGYVPNAESQGDVIISIENFIGSAFDDGFRDNGGNNLYQTGDGNDDVIDGGGVDTIDGGAGRDVVFYVFSNTGVVVNLTTNVNTGGYAQGDLLYGIEVVIGSTYTDTLTGDANNNVFVTHLGADTVDGGAGTDGVVYTSSQSAVNVNLNLATAQSGGDAAGDVLISIEDVLGSIYNDTLQGNNSNNLLQGDGGNDVLSGGAGADTLEGGTGSDAMSGGADNDTYLVDVTGDTVSENAGEGIDTILSPISYTLGNHVENLALTGTAAITATGNALDNVLTGNSGNNTLNGGAGNDTLTGGAGNDIFVVPATVTTLTLTDFVPGSDKLDFTAFPALSSISNLSPVQNGANTIMSTGGITLTLLGVTATSVSASDLIWISGGPGISLTGTAGADTLTGTAGADTLDGLAGNDSLVGGDGYDTLIGGAGGDTLDGGAGIDTLSYAAAPASIYLDLALTTPQPGYVPNAESQGDVIISIENFIGSAFDDGFRDNGGNNLYQTGDGNDDVIDGGGVDTIDGGAGRDVVFYVFSNTGVVVNLTTNVNTGGYAQGDLLYGIEVVIGSTYTDTLTGDANNNVFVTHGGADTVDGGAGTDGVVYTSSQSAVNVNLNLATAQSGGDAAGDVLISIEDVLGSIYNDTLQGNGSNNLLQGDGGNDVLSGGAGADTLEGGTGSDAMSGGADNDTYLVDVTGDTVSENAGEGIDTILSPISYTLGNHVENLALTGTAAITATGNALGNVLTGNSGNNTLNGGAGNDTLTGGAGNDYLDGGTENDLLVGGTGSDTYAVNSTADVVTENLNEGSDTVITTADNYTLGANIENLTLITTTIPLHGTGNELNNIIIGGGGDDSLIGAAGADTLDGGTGNGTDTFIYQAITDSGIGAGNRDVITALNLSQTDRIDLSAFTGTFVFRGTSAFTGGANPELRYLDDGSNTIVQVDADHDTLVDFEIQISGHLTLVSGHFVL